MKKRERILTRMLLILMTFFIVALILTQLLQISGLISTEERILSFSAIILPGLFASGIYASRKFARDYQEFAWGVTAFIMLSVFFGGFLYLLYLAEIGLTLTFINFILYMFLLLLPISMAIGFFIFEILVGRKIRNPFSFHIKRFVGRMILSETIFLLIVAISSLINLLAPFVPEQHLLTILIFANLAVSIALYAMIRNTKIGHFFSRLEKGEW
ncbi:MAG: hypothetical protein ACFFCW_43635 [Candidatus Hodarchaeota archaeon]